MMGPQVVGNIGLPDRGWRWLGPWAVDNGSALCPVDRRRATGGRVEGSDGGAGGGGGGGGCGDEDGRKGDVGGDMAWVYADGWPAPGAPDEEGRPGPELGFYTEIEGVRRGQVARGGGGATPTVGSALGASTAAF